MSDNSLIAITGKINEIGTAYEEFKKVDAEREAARKKGDESRAAELNAKLDKIGASLDESSKAKKEIEAELKFQRERLEDVESRANQPGKTDRERQTDQYKGKFLDWIRHKGSSPMIETELHDLMRKDVTVASPAGGGYAVPEDISRMIGELQLKYSPVRDLVKVVQVGTSDYKELIDLNGATSGWVGESDSRTATSTSTLREVAPTHGEIYAYPQASEWSLDDMFFNVEQWISDSVARSFAIAEANAVLTGNGSNKPTGMLNTTPVTTADNAVSPRAAAAYQYLLGADNSPASIDADSLIDMFYTLNSAYRGASTWIMNSLTVAQVRKLKDKLNQQYLWQPSLQMGQPEMLLARPVSVWEQMSDPLGGQFPIAIGDWKQAYLLTERTGLRVTRDNVTNVGYIRFYVRRREGGQVLNNNAAKWLKLL